MKTIRLIMYTIAILLITLGIANLDKPTNAVILLTTALFIVGYVIITTRHENALERKYDRLEIANTDKIYSLIKEREQLKADIFTLEIMNKRKSSERTVEEDYKNNKVTFTNAPIDDFQNITPYIGQIVKVRYGGSEVVSEITKIFDKPSGETKYKVKGTGRREYSINELQNKKEKGE